MYKIMAVYDKNNNHKTVPQEWLDTDLFLTRIIPGHSAVLEMLDFQGNAIITSVVESVIVVGNIIELKTANSIYCIGYKEE